MGKHRIRNKQIWIKILLRITSCVILTYYTPLILFPNLQKEDDNNEILLNSCED